VELQHPKLHRPAHSDEINLDATFDVDTPEHQPCRSLFSPAKRQKLDKKPWVFPPLSASKGDQSLVSLEAAVWDQI